MQQYLITADIADPRRLQRVARICERWGERLQRSVYLMALTPEQLYRLQADLAQCLSATHDTVRYYPLCRLDIGRSAVEGTGKGLAPPVGHWLV